MLKGTPRPKSADRWYMRQESRERVDGGEFGGGKVT